MKDRSRIRFNPVTKDIEIEGSEEFVKAYFNKLRETISGPSKKIVAKPKAEKARPVKKAPKKPKAVKARPPKKAGKAKKKEPGVKRVTNMDAVATLIQESMEGISTSELKAKTGLTERQIWSIVNRTAKQGKIRKMKRGVYGGAAASQ
jgi:hypothetical protein